MCGLLLITHKTSAGALSSLYLLIHTIFLFITSLHCFFPKPWRSEMSECRVIMMVWALTVGFNLESHSSEALCSLLARSYC